jgi:hypothetical protein
MDNHMNTPIQAGDFFVAPNGNDSWTGLLPEPNATHTDGPFASVSGAKLVVFEMLRRGRFDRRVNVWLRGGRYHLTSPLTFDQHESGEVTFAAYPGEEPIFDGGTRITNWTQETVNERAAWVADVSALVDQYGPFRSLFANSQRCARPRFPKAGYFLVDEVVESGETEFFTRAAKRFVAAPGDMKQWQNLTDAEVVGLHWWIEERMPIVRYDDATRIVYSSRTSMMPMSKDTRYYVENIFEALTEAGEWYLNRETKKLYYLPQEGQTPENTEIVVPLTLQFLRVMGDVEHGDFVEGLRFEGLAFEYSDWVQPEAWCHWYDPYTPRETWRMRDSARHFIKNNGGNPHDEKASNPQSAYNAPGVLHFEGARHCAVENCRIEHIGFYGIDLREGCVANRIIGNTIRDMGGGGIKQDGGGTNSPLQRRTGRNRITDNLIASGGRVFISAMGIVSMFCDATVIAHNEIHDLYQTGISVGWRWDYEEHVTRDMQVEKNHIYNLGQGILSDMGGIYTLGVQSGTVLRGNYIHHMVSGGYGACGIYLDQASSNIIVEENLVHHVGESVSTHWGRSNIFRNNIFAFADKQGVFLGREPHHQWVDYPRKGLWFERNLFILDGEPAFIDYERFLEEGVFRSDMNLFWDINKAQPLVYKFAPWREGEINFDWGYCADDNAPGVRLFDLESWKKTGHDAHSIVADPQCANLTVGDFTLASASPARQLGFRPLSISDVGPRAPEARSR